MLIPSRSAMIAHTGEASQPNLIIGMSDMKRVYTYCMFLAALLQGELILPMNAQTVDDSAFIKLAKSRPEKLVVFTDRSLYAVNEIIRFTAILQSGAYHASGPGSDVIYAELLNAAGNAVTKGKYLLSANRSSGYLSIPPSIHSGNYYLRCYTRWMRNFGAGDFSFIPIRVVNPYLKEVEEVSTEPGKQGLSVIHIDKPAIFCSTKKHTYVAGEKVDIEFTPVNGSISHIQEGCVTVVPEGSIDISALLYRVDDNPGIEEPFQLKFLPDRKGTAISGSVMNDITGEPSPGTRIHFTILGKDPAYIVTTSDQEGRFLIRVPARTGNQEMFVVPEQKPDAPLEVLIDNDFSTEPLPFQAEPFSLQENEKILASRISLQMQLQQNYLSASENDTTGIATQTEYIPFYGIPEISVKLDEFINLPNMQEVIVNLLPKIYVVRRGGSEYFMIKSENPMISQYQPLVLIDHIPVFDMKVVLAISPSKIDRIEVIPEIYVLGEVKYGGIICFTSREGDLAGMTLPEGSYFFDFTALQPPLVQPHPRYPDGSRMPDTRNTLFWKDHMEFDKEHPGKISFQAASVPGNYLILFRGVSSEGEIVYGSDHIHVE
jgi:hypothetical protein